MRVAPLILVLSCMASSVALAAPATAPTTQPPRVTLYDANPDHLWNRLHQTLLVRTSRTGEVVGLDTLDPILWTDTKHLLEGDSHRQAVARLDEFLSNSGEKLIDEPLRRAILQRDLWAVFDWTCRRDPAPEHAAAARALQDRLAPAIHRLALTPAQIRELPDTYAAAVGAARFAAEPNVDHPDTPFLPPDLFEEKGPWIYLATPGEGIVAPAHQRSFDGRFVFEAFFRHPDGRDAGIKYLRTISTFRDQFVLVPEGGRSDVRNRPQLNPALPQFPIGTRVALVRRTMLIDSDGKLAPTRLVESIQLRVYRRIAPDVASIKKADQSFHEFHFTRKDLFADPVRALRPLGKDDKEVLFVQLASHGIDYIEAPHRGQRRITQPVMNSCFGCHNGPGIFAMNTFTHSFGPPTLSPALTDISLGHQESEAIQFKRDRFDWGLLKGMRPRK